MTRGASPAHPGAPAHISPYHAPGFYDGALAQGAHRSIVGGRWDEIGRLQLSLLMAEGLRPDHRLLDIGAGALRAGRLLVPYLAPGHYWATDLSGALLERGYQVELSDESRARLPPAQLAQDGDFSFPGVPADIDYVNCFAVFTHLPMNHLRRALMQVAQHFPALRKMLFTVFLADDGAALRGPLRQPDGAVTHDCRAPYHLLAEDVAHFAGQAGLRVERRGDPLPRGQALFVAQRAG